tara:strand:+ start:1055 stop:1510 length:456 start_codon:yes stop_codon:yes gene_type:complete
MDSIIQTDVQQIIENAYLCHQNSKNHIYRLLGILVEIKRKEMIILTYEPNYRRWYHIKNLSSILAAFIGNLKNDYIIIEQNIINHYFSLYRLYIYYKTYNLISEEKEIQFILESFSKKIKIFNNVYNFMIDDSKKINPPRFQRGSNPCQRG